MLHAFLIQMVVEVILMDLMVIGVVKGGVVANTLLVNTVWAMHRQLIVEMNRAGS